MPRTVSMIGLGLMGGTMASRLLMEGHDVIGYDPVVSSRAEHLERGGTVAESVADALTGAEFAILSLPNSSIMLDVCGEIAAARPVDLLVIDTTTGEPDDSLEAAALLGEIGVGYVDATISGNAAMAATGDTIFMVGGAQALVESATEILRPLCRRIHSVGAVGNGSRTKLVVNHVLSINRAALAEALTVSELLGLDLEKMLEVLRDSAAYSKAMDIWGERMVNADHYPPASRVRQTHKDIKLITAQADHAGGSNELARVVRTALAEAEAGGLADADNSSIIEVMRRRAGIGRIDQ
jgi:3-hydroxyisobutyrate dehydrogenase-like beta-hydroxyacid dehydrogenase